MTGFLKLSIRLFLQTKPVKLLKKTAPFQISYIKSLLENYIASAPIPGQENKKRLSAREKISSLKEACDFVEHYDIISLDIFDTLIARHVHPPEVPFTRSGHAAKIIFGHILPEINSDIFIKKRDFLIHKHRQQNAKKGFDFECKIDDVLRDTVKELKIPQESIDSCVEKLLENEVARECATLHVIDDVIEFLQYCKSRNKKVIAVSDMYFSKQDIEKILQTKNILEYFDKIYVSSEYKLKKSSGKLFKYILKELEIHPETVLHIGDNLHSDVISSRKCGIFSLWVNNPKTVALKKNIGHYYTTSQSFPGYLKRKIRKYFHIKPEKQFEDFINNHIALDICNFVFDFLCKAKTENIETIYFLERDGTIFYHLANIFQEKIALFKGINHVRLERACISRRKSAALVDHHSPEAVLERAFRIHHPDNFSIMDILAAFGISENFLSEKLQMSILKNNDNKVFFHRIYHKILKPLIKSQQDKIVEYLHELKMFENKKFAVCDIGWGGTIQKDIADYINRSNLARECTGFYYGTDQRAHELDRYYPATRFTPGYSDSALIAGSYSAVEFFVQDYSSADEETIKNLGIETISLNKKSRETIIEFSHKFAEFVNTNSLLPSEISPLSQVLARNFFSNPPARLLKTIKNVKFNLGKKNSESGILLIPKIKLLKLRADIKNVSLLSQWKQAGIQKSLVLIFLKRLKKISSFIF